MECAAWLCRVVCLDPADNSVVCDFTMESSFRHPPHEQFLKGQTVIGETLKHRR